VQPMLMTLEVLVPFEVLVKHVGVLRIVAETREGSFGLLPRRRDCVATLTPGILLVETEAEGESYTAIDEGVLIKTGPNVLVSVRRAIGGTDLDRLRQSVDEEFLTLNAQERGVRAVMTKLETGFLRRFASLHDE